MYKVASDSRQRALSHGRLSDWVTWDDQQSPVERLENLKRAVQRMDARIQLSEGEERRLLGLEKLKMQGEIRELRSAANLQKDVDRGFEQVILDIVKETLSPGQFKTILAAAKRRFDMKKAALADEARRLSAANASTAGDEQCTG
jgi:HAMP domain-containing protein